MSGLDRMRLPLAAFLAAALGGLGLALALEGDPERPAGPRAQAPEAQLTELREARLPTTPSLKVGASPRAPVAVGRPAPQASAPTDTPVAPSPAQPSPGTGGLGIEEQTVVSP